MNEAEGPDRPMHLVVHDYGMGGVWFWVRARSAAEIVASCSEVEVVDDNETVARFEGDDDVAAFDLDALPAGSVLAGLRDKRDSQRGRPGFGALVGRERVYLSDVDEEDDTGTLFLVELGPDGRQLRNVVVEAGGPGVRRDMTTWPINPPFDLYDPDLAAKAVDAAVFEAAWRRAAPDPDDEQ
ncbi:hypothetical protein CLV63_102210 [Murinocardiopsis flavida]|uniref:Uncharacterized protein n=1 Tax=Murinocardiopsis flavida TaxID=645275 RepID=A0A2P8DS86_9ACTN|nr:hypothetical protein [Murinocardiopsis flavida]PSL00084.1 hypothetical protein CLV63_102210 [Murinocardiopsis flavida]